MHRSGNRRFSFQLKEHSQFHVQVFNFSANEHISLKKFENFSLHLNKMLFLRKNCQTLLHHEALIYSPQPGYFMSFMYIFSQECVFLETTVQYMCSVAFQKPFELLCPKCLHFSDLCKLTARTVHVYQALSKESCPKILSYSRLFDDEVFLYKTFRFL